MSLSQTILRYLQADGNAQGLSPNLLINPAFEHMEGADTATIPTQFSSALRGCPGWFDYGSTPAGFITDIVNIVPNPSPTSLSSNGVAISQSIGKTKGLCQQIFRGSALRGRRIRVSGAYHVDTLNDPASSSTGISLWLKSDKLSVITGEANWRTVDFGGGSPVGRWNALEFTGTDVRHIIRVTNSANAYTVGEELLNRAFDWLGAGPIGTIGVGVKYLALGGPSGDEGIPTPSPTTNAQSLKTWYLDSTFSNVPSSGQMQLFSEVQTATGSLVYFEKYIDIPDDPALFEDDDIWLCVFPTEPLGGSITSTQAAKITLWGLSVQVVLNGGVDSILTGDRVAPPRASGVYQAGMPLRYMLRYPIYQAQLLPLDTTPTYVVNDVSGAYDWAQAIPPSQTSASTYTVLANSAGSNVSAGTVQGQLPPGSCVVRASIDKQTQVIGSAIPLLKQVLSYASNVGADAVKEFPIVSWADQAVGSDPNFVEAVQDAHRNKVGGFWPLSSSLYAGDIESVGRMAAAKIELRTVVSTGTTVWISGNYIEALVDPRWGNALWTRG